MPHRDINVSHNLTRTSTSTSNLDHRRALFRRSENGAVLGTVGTYLCTHERVADYHLIMGSLNVSLKERGEGVESNKLGAIFYEEHRFLVRSLTIPLPRCAS